MEDLGVLLAKFTNIIDSLELIGETDIGGVSSEMILLKRIEPVHDYTCGFVERHMEFVSSKPFSDFANAINYTFVDRMNELNQAIHSNKYSNSHVKKIFAACEKEIDEMIIEYPTYEKIVEDFIEEFEEIKKVADLQND